MEAARVVDIDRALGEIKDRGAAAPDADDLRPPGPAGAARRPPGAAAVLEQLPRPGGPPARARGRRRGGHALRRGRGRVAPDLGHDAHPPPAGGAAGRLQAQPRPRCCSARATWPTPASRRRWRARARSCSPTSSTTPASIDGCRLAGAETFVYRHGDAEHLAWGLEQAQGRGSLIVTDGVFSMDGDIAPLEQIVKLARDHDARVMVDEAHGTGAIGPGGRGAVAAAGRRGRGGRAGGHPRQGARVLRGLRLLLQADGEVPREHRAHVHLLDRAGAAVGGGRDGGARAAARAAAPGGEAPAQRRADARGAAGEGPRRRAGRHADPAAPHRRCGEPRRRPASRRSRAASSPRRSARRPCPRAPRACG